MELFEKDIENCLAALRSGGLILYPTDTIWGIGCDATNDASVEKIYALKKRPEDKAMIVLVAEEKDVLRYTAAPDLAVFDHLEKTKKPTTVIYEGAIGLAAALSAPDGSIAIRICQDPFCRQLIKRFRKPIVSSSANFSGEPAPACFGDIVPEIKKAVDYAVHYRREERSAASPSSLIRWNNGRIEILRP